MEIVKVSEENQQQFVELDPLMLLQRKNFGINSALGAYIEDKRSGKKIPAGLAIYTEAGDTLVLLWMQIAPRFQRMGYGDEFLGYIIELAEERGMVQISAAFDDSSLRRALCLGEEVYFREHGFKREQRLPGACFSDVKNLLKHERTKTSGSHPMMAPLGEIKGELLDHCMQQIRENPATASVWNLENQEYDEELSHVIFNRDGTVSGTILVLDTGDSVCPSVFLAESEEDASILIHTALAAAEEKFGPDMPVEIFLIYGRYEEILKEILPVHWVSNYILTADVSWYRDPLRYDLSRVVSGTELPEDLDYLSEETNLMDYLKEGEQMELSSEQLAQTAVMKGDYDMGNVKSLGKLSVRQFENMVLDCSYYGYSGVLDIDPGQMSPEWFDPELSCCLMEKGRVTHLFLIHLDEEGMILPVMLCAIGDADKRMLAPLMKYAFGTALDFCPDGTKIILRVHDAWSKAVIGGVLGK